jgi:hypothetical protein
VRGIDQQDLAAFLQCVIHRLPLDPSGFYRHPHHLVRHDTRMVHLMEVLLHGGTHQVLGWRTSDIHKKILSSFALTAERYRLTQLPYDLHKLKAHGLLERVGRRYA